MYSQRDVVLHSGACVHLVMHKEGERYVVDVLPVVEEEEGGYTEDDFTESVEELTVRLRSAVEAAECNQSAVEVVNRLMSFDRCFGVPLHSPSPARGGHRRVAVDGPVCSSASHPGPCDTCDDALHWSALSSSPAVRESAGVVPTCGHAGHS